ncbi:MAG: DUF4135 domain-containing protein [Holophagales bacterium]|nr:DUF4135 domain-containing protein [Holophagales bacterium]
MSATARARGETLHDRLARLAGSEGEGRERAEIERRLAPWCRAAAAGDEAAFARRLAWDSIAPERAAGALAAEAGPPPEDPGTDDWLRSVAERARGRAEASPPATALGDLPFAEIVAPWVAEAETRLERATPAWRDSLSPAVRGAWSAGLARRLSWLAALPLYARFGRVRVVDEGGDVYARWVASELDAGLSGIWEEFPRLALQMAGRCADWLEASAELLGRLEADRDALAERFGDGAPPGAVETLDTALSDPHARGRRVVAVRFASGLSVVYKPRSVALEAWLAELLDWARGSGLEIAPPSVATLDRGEYGWQERVEPWEAGSEEEVRRWFEGAGALAAFAWLLGARDLHAENLVAQPGGPALVDAEMLLAPRLAGAAAAPERFEGILATGLVADPSAPAGAGALGTVGLSGPEPGALAPPDRRWSGIGRDDLRLAFERSEAPTLANVLRRDGRPQRVEAYAAAAVGGFERAASFVAGRRDELLAPGGLLDRAAGVRTRILFRPSAQYGEVLSLLVRPSYLADGLASGLLLEALLRVFAPSVERPRLWPLVAEERAALERLDVPVFGLPVDSATLVSAGGEQIGGWFALSGVEAARDRLLRLDARAASREGEALRRALAPRRMSRAAEERRLGGAASAMAAALFAAPDFGAEPPPAAGLRDLSLYGGACGRALFAAGAYRTTGETRWRDLAERLAGAVVEAVRVGGAEGDDRERPGGTDGWGSLVWSLVTLAELLEAPEWLDGARLAAAALETVTGSAPSWGYDLAAGEAGALLGLLALAESGDADALERAAARGRRLLDAAGSESAWAPPGGGPPLAGFAHGAAGIARALDALARATGERAFAAAAAAGRGYERALFDGDRGDWPVLVAGRESGSVERRWLASWCHGAPGIALDRALALALSDVAEKTARAELEVAAATLSRLELPEVDHLCCGTAGRVTALASAARWLGSEARLGAARELARRALARAEGRGGWSIPTGGPDGERAELGFFRGYPGLAWSLVSLTPAGAALPIVAALELPSERRGRTGA